MRPLAKCRPFQIVPDVKQECLELCGMLTDSACKLRGLELEQLRDDLRVVVSVTARPEGYSDDEVERIIKAVFSEEE